MGEGKRAQPALLAREPERDGGAEGAPQQVGVGELDGPRHGGGAGGVDDHGDGVEVVSTADGRRRQAAAAPGAGAAGPLRQRPIDEHLAPGGDPLALLRGEAQIDGHGDGAEQQAGVERLGEVQAAGQRDRHARAGAGAAGGKLAGAGAGGGVQAGIGPAARGCVQGDVLGP